MNSKDKENQPFEPHESRVKTPLKQKATSNLFLAEIQPAASCHLRTPPKPNEISPADPWTPTANLKMLISAASPEIRNREQGKKLMDNRSEILEAKFCTQDHLSGDEYEKSQPSRKEKSLGLLCHKFLAHYPYPSPSENNEICLDEVAEELNVERRRIYDIMNVLESLHMVNRLAKNKYAWHGCHNLRRTLQVLKKVAEENKYLQQIQLIKKREHEEKPEGNDQRTELVVKHDIPSNHMDISFVELPGMEFRGASVNSRKDKSLRVMSQKFVMLFLVSAPQVVSLEAAAKILIGEDHAENLDKSKFKTKIRRLYDIANVLSSLDLIKKVHVTEEKGRKPAFKWTGPDVFSDVQGRCVPIFLHSTLELKTSKEHCSKNLFPTRCKQRFTRHPSLIKLPKNIQNDHRKIHSAPSSPIKKNTSHIPSSFPSKMAQLAAICKQQLDEQSRELKKTTLRLASSPLPCTLALQPESCLKCETFLLPSHVEVLPVIHSSASPPVLPHIHSNVSYAVYVHPSQTQMATAYNPSFTVQPVPCANVIGIKYPARTGSKAAPGKMYAEGNDINLGESDAHAKGESLRAAEKQEGSKDDCTPEKLLKRCKLVLEYSPVKKCKSEEVKLQDMLLGESMKNSNTQSSVALRLDQEVLASSAEEQNEYKSMKQSRGDESKQQKQRNRLGDDSAFPAQKTPAHKAWFPSSYLIPVPQCTQLGNEMTASNKGKAEMCLAEQKSYSSLTAGAIPVTSEFTAVNLPAFHITPMNLMLPTSSVPTIPVVNNTILPSVAHANPVQAPNSSVLNFALQHFGLIPATLQISADPGLGSALIHQGAECVSSVSKSVDLKQGETVEHSHELNGKEFLTVSLQQTKVPVTCGVCQEGNETAFHAASKPAIVPSSCLSNFDGSSKGHC
ncbi:PREDICTED: transcription factor E2F8 [Gekko japonicus]|uniref:Transcription factor E2F8 n=1 Tax=Gekko japonicus TaxID=146911 RepID=A0ABM1L1R4_GEKJA|nr:PREDICTED: transcription factor E2F8 [Gekko japonicus]